MKCSVHNVDLLTFYSFSGCDGVTYGSECDADAARADIRHYGECEVEETSVTPCPAIFAPVW